MEEKKAKTVKMEAKEEQKKLSYEQLEQIANSLNLQCRQLQENLREAQNLISGFNMLEALLNIIEKGEYFESSFVDKCVKRIQAGVTTLLENTNENADNKK